MSAAPKLRPAQSPDLRADARTDCGHSSRPAGISAADKESRVASAFVSSCVPRFRFARSTVSFRPMLTAGRSSALDSARLLPALTVGDEWRQPSAVRGRRGSEWAKHCAGRNRRTAGIAAQYAHSSAEDRWRPHSGVVHQICGSWRDERFSSACQSTPVATIQLMPLGAVTTIVQVVPLSDVKTSIRSPLVATPTPTCTSR